MAKAPLGRFLAGNPFPKPLTLGFFYREKMRAIHRIAPAEGVARVLEVGGGQSGLARLLYPDARVVNIDFNASYGHSACNRQPGVSFVCADATRLPFADASFDVVTMFDLLEHVPDDRRAAAEAERVLRPGGHLLVSTPRENWRFPHYGVFRPFCPPEKELWDAWGHVRRGYSVAELERLIPLQKAAVTGFINPVTVINHDVAFSRLPAKLRWLLCLGLSPVTWLGYWMHAPHHGGTESATAWRKPASGRGAAA